MLAKKSFGANRHKLHFTVIIAVLLKAVRDNSSLSPYAADKKLGFNTHSVEFHQTEKTALVPPLSEKIRENC